MHHPVDATVYYLIDRLLAPVSPVFKSVHLSSALMRLVVSTTTGRLVVMGDNPGWRFARL